MIFKWTSTRLTIFLVLVNHLIRKFAIGSKNVGAFTFGSRSTSRAFASIMPHHMSTSLLSDPSSSSMMGIKSIGVDYGLMRTGIAVTMGYAPIPLAILQNSTNIDIYREIIQMVTGERASQIVVGLPLHKNGTLSEQANLTSAFASQLACHCHSNFGPHFPVFMFDERYSSKEAAARAKSSSSSSTLNSFQLSGTLDADSACIILEHFYAVNGEGKIRIEAPSEMLEQCQLEYEQRTHENQQQLEELQKRREQSLNARQEMMKKAKLMEEQMKEDGILKRNNKKKKKKKKKMKTMTLSKTSNTTDTTTSMNLPKKKWITF